MRLALLSRAALGLCLVLGPLAAASQPISDRYIVLFHDSVGNPRAQAAALTRAAGGQLHHVYGSAVKGFAATLPPQALQGLLNNPNVASVEQDQVVTLGEPETTVQTGATWGLDRIDERPLTLNGQYNYTATGSGVHAFIIDTGIRGDHAEFTGRLVPGATAIADGRGTEDCNGHGTHVAGTVGGTTWGVAKEVKLVPVRVLNCRGSGSWSGVIAGVDWVAASPLRPAVANMSLGGGFSSAVNSAVAGAVAQGVTMVVAAGNSNANACNYSPASEPSALTVGATTSTDARASYSNYGTCLDLFAPGSAITSAWYTSSTASHTISGTSMASPHVAGVAALALQNHPTASPGALGAFLTTGATAGVVGAPGSGSPNLLLFSLLTGTPAEPTAATVAVSSLQGAAARAGKNWKATATVTVSKYVNTGFSGTVSGATVTGTFHDGTAATSASCVTGSTGSCSVSKTYGGSVGASTFTVTGITGYQLAYDSSKNVATAVTITWQP